MSAEIEGIRNRMQRYDNLVDLRDQQIQDLSKQFKPGVEAVEANNAVAVHIRKATKARERNQAKRNELGVQIQDARERMQSGLTQAQELVDQGFYPREIYDSQKAELSSLFPPASTPEPSEDLSAEALSQEHLPWQSVPIPVELPVIPEVGGYASETPVREQPEASTDKKPARKRGEEFPVLLPDGTIWTTRSRALSLELPRLFESPAHIDDLIAAYPTDSYSDDIERNRNIARAPMYGSEASRLIIERGIGISNIDKKGTGGTYIAVDQNGKPVSYKTPEALDVTPAEVSEPEVERVIAALEDDDYKPIKYRRFTLRRLTGPELPYGYEVLRGEHERDWSKSRKRETAIPKPEIKEVKPADLAIKLDEAGALLMAISSNRDLFERYDIDGISALTYNRLRERIMENSTRFQREQIVEMKNQALNKLFGLLASPDLEQAIDNLEDPDVKELVMHFALQSLESREKAVRVINFLNEIHVFHKREDNIFRPENPWSYEGGTYLLWLPVEEGETVFGAVKQLPDAKASLEEPDEIIVKVRDGALEQQIRILEKRDPNARIHIRRYVEEAIKYGLPKGRVLIGELSRLSSGLSRDFVEEAVRRGYIRPSGRNRRSQRYGIEDYVLLRYHQTYGEKLSLDPKAFEPPAKALFEEIFEEVLAGNK